MNRHGYKVLLRSWFGTKSDLMIGSEGKSHGWDLESFEPTSYPPPSPRHFFWFPQQGFQDRALARQLSSSTEVHGHFWSRLCQSRGRRTPEGAELQVVHAVTDCGGKALPGAMRRGAEGGGLSSGRVSLSPRIFTEHFLKDSAGWRERAQDSQQSSCPHIAYQSAHLRMI